jgi:hypothetical protein
MLLIVKSPHSEYPVFSLYYKSAENIRLQETAL